MQTITHMVPLSETSKQLPNRILQARTMSNADFIEEHGSGTLRDNKKIGFTWSIQCMSERVAYTFGYGFSLFKSHNVTFNNSISECDEKAYTMAGRWFKAYQAKKLFEEDHFELKYVIIKDECGITQWEGIAVVVTQTSASFIPNNTIVLGLICQFNEKQQTWETPVNFA